MVTKKIVTYILSYFDVRGLFGSCIQKQNLLDRYNFCKWKDKVYRARFIKHDKTKDWRRLYYGNSVSELSFYNELNLISNLRIIYSCISLYDSVLTLIDSRNAQEKQNGWMQRVHGSFKPKVKGNFSVCVQSVGKKRSNTKQFCIATL